MDSKPDVAEHSAATDCSTADLWFERFAELLGCEPRPAIIAATIDELKATINRIPAEIARNRTAERDSLIRSMRCTAVNCGQSSTCSVAGWFKTSDEQ